MGHEYDMLSQGDTKKLGSHEGTKYLKQSSGVHLLMLP